MYSRVTKKQEVKKTKFDKNRKTRTESGKARSKIMKKDKRKVSDKKALNPLEENNNGEENRMNTNIKQRRQQPKVEQSPTFNNLKRTTSSELALWHIRP